MIINVPNVDNYCLGRLLVDGEEHKLKKKKKTEKKRKTNYIARYAIEWTSSEGS